MGATENLACRHRRKKRALCFPNSGSRREKERAAI